MPPAGASGILPTVRGEAMRQAVFRMKLETEGAVMSERDVWMAAGVLIREFGEQAIIEASNKADQFQKLGDVDGQRTWMRIVHAAAAMLDVDSRMAH